MGAATGPAYKIGFRRRRENRTNYGKRLGLIKGDTPRLVVRASNHGVVVQIVAFEQGKGDKTLAAAHSRELAAHGWMPQSNTPTAFLVGLMAGHRAKKAGVKGFHMDIGMSTPTKGGVIFAAGLGAKAAGLSAELDEKLVDAKRLDGSHIADFAKKLKTADSAKYSKHFSRYESKKIDVTNLPAVFAQVRSKISG